MKPRSRIIEIYKKILPNKQWSPLWATPKENEFYLITALIDYLDEQWEKNQKTIDDGIFEK